MILVFVTNERIGEVADLVRSLKEQDRVSYRNPRYWKGRVEDVSKVYIHGDFPKLKEAYSDRLIEEQKRSTDYTIAELRKMKDSIDDWEAFTKGDTRSSIDQI